MSTLIAWIAAALLLAVIYVVFTFLNDWLWLESAKVLAAILLLGAFIVGMLALISMGFAGVFA